MSAANSKVKRQAPPDRESGTRPAVKSIDQSTHELLARALGSDGIVSMSAGAIEAMAVELHHLTYRLAFLEERLEEGGVRNDIEEIGNCLAGVAYRAQAVAELERKLTALRVSEGAK